MSLNKKSLAGYRLHKNRVLFSGKTIIRTVKYPISPSDKSNLQQIDFIDQLMDATIKDDLKIKGDLNLNDYLEYTNQNKPLYTLFDFWYDSLKAGVVWMPTASKLVDFVSRFYSPITSPVDQIWDKAHPNIKEFFDKKSFTDGIILINQVRNRSTKNSFKDRLLKCLKDKFKEEKKGKKRRIVSKEAEDLINFIVNSFFDENNNLILDTKQQNEFWKKNFNIDKSILENAKPKGELKDITFFIIPELIAEEKDSLEELILKRRSWLSKKNLKEKEIDKWLEEILGLGNEFNGFSNYFGVFLKTLQKNEIDKIINALTTLSPELNHNKDKIYQALTYLAEKAKKLEKPSFPLALSWAEYRSAFGGKLKSWFSNFTRRENELDNQIKDFESALRSAQEAIKEKSKNLNNQETENIQILFERLNKFVSENKEKIKQEESYEVFNSLLSALKNRLNFFYQTYLQEEDDESKVTDRKEFQGIYEKIYKPVAFFGYSSQKRNRKIVEKTIPIIEDGINLILNLLTTLTSDFDPSSTFESSKRKNDTEESNYRRLLQFFLDKLHNLAVNSPDFKTKYEDILQKELINPSWSTLTQKKDFGRYVIYKSPYAKGSLIQIELNQGNWLIKYQQLVLDLKNFLQQFKKEDLLKDEKLLLDWIELSKNIFSHLLRFNKKSEFSIDNLNLENFDTARIYINLFSLSNLNKNEFGFLIQSLVFSALKGAANLYSKKNYIAKYTLQIINSNERIPLFYQPKSNQIDLKTVDLKSNDKSLAQPHQYLISLSKIKINKNKDPNLIQIDKESINKVFLDDDQLKNLFLVSSSPYQLQFLDRLFYKPKGWENIKITLGEWSLIVEKEYQIKWDLETKKPQLSLKHNSKKNKLYLAVPFNIAAKIKPSRLENIVKNRLNYPILGVDVGEYGLGYCLISVPDGQIKIKKTGFIVDKNVANIKDKFLKIKQKARQGIFDEIDSSVSRVRENAIGHLRNQLHVVLTADEGASVIYEYQISSFETGSNKTIKIYNSVKKADVELGSEADKQTHNHIWGENAKLIGRHLTAYASSYTCSQCHRSLYDIKQNDLDQGEIIPYQGNILTIKTKKGTLYGFSQNKKYQNEKNYYLKNTNESLQEFRKLVKDFARPPVSKNSEVLNKFASYLFKDEKSFEKFKKDRGNSAIFVCPFVGCQFVADADIQAAFMMAIRGYLNFQKNVKSQKESYQDKNNQLTKSTGESYLEETINLLKSTNFSPADFFKPLR